MHPCSFELVIHLQISTGDLLNHEKNLLHLFTNSLCFYPKLGSDLNKVSADVVKVMTSDDGVQMGDYYPAMEKYTKCSVSSTPVSSSIHQFDCTCISPCSYYVQIVFKSMAAANALGYAKVCEIGITDPPL